ncbi:(5-formylfuran-3-yl)methyl phosphate synthase [Methylobacter sp.]|uniref:(5-formylfuran-3-yl)methyl phosphate synthase n=1 Tax=Methylobacter sp. TaxID=2051955 RepID=UPI002FDD66A9
MTGMLASVNSVEEALLALTANVDIIDLKQPALGALGALETDLVTSIVVAIGGRRPVSATVGDLPMEPELVYSAVKNMAETGVDYIKIGFFSGGDWQGTIEKLAMLPRTMSLIAVLFADTHPDFSVIDSLANAGFKGVMLDTMNKNNGALTQVMPQTDIAQFVRLVKDRQLLCGLAGSLKLDDIAELIPYQPDYLGFRGALCLDHNRTAQLNKSSIMQIKQTIAEHHQNPLQSENSENRILIADDSEINRLILANMLELNGYTVDAAANGREALQFIRKNPYKFALIDLSMPVMSGLEMVKILREQHNPLKTAAISTFAVDSQRTEALDAGFDYCLTRPIDEEQLIALINLR